MRGICKLKLKNKAVEGSKEVERKEGNAFEKSDIHTMCLQIGTKICKGEVLRMCIRNKQSINNVVRKV